MSECQETKQDFPMTKLNNHRRSFVTLSGSMDRPSRLRLGWFIVTECFHGLVLDRETRREVIGRRFGDEGDFKPVETAREGGGGRLEGSVEEPERLMSPRSVSASSAIASVLYRSRPRNMCYTIIQFSDDLRP